MLLVNFSGLRDIFRWLGINSASDREQMLLKDGVGNGVSRILGVLSSLFEGGGTKSEVIYALEWIEKCGHETHR